MIKGSSSIAPTRLRGFRLAYGFWNTICTSGRRRFLVARPASATLAPAIHNSPPVGGSIIVIWRAKVDLPQPDSPTTARVLPRASSNDTPSSARASPLGFNQPCDTG